MAKSNAVWGIDLGQCALKALRCLPGEEKGSVVADAFDYIEYPKILSAPDAEPEELIREAIEQFMSRNELRGDKVAISVSGQAGLSRFFKPPPVDAKTIPDIVKYEARQQIPFALEDVIWDYQQMGGTVVDGFTLDAEVGLFAMKRDAVFRALRPFLDADIEVDIIQLAPLCVFNLVLHDVLTDLPDPEELDPENPPESMIVLSMGTETSDLVITNGSKLWQRSIPLGGNHFTKQLTKELKLTYAKAEHLKRNARQAEDPKTVFQVMRPVFNDLVTEIQRSITYFQSIDRQAKMGQLVMLGNGVKLPGLRQYLSKNLGTEAVKIDTIKSLSGANVVSDKKFADNILSFGVCYGLCLQGLGESFLNTNLLPREFVTERLIREKKPWALAAVGALLLGLSFNFYFNYNAWYKTDKTRPYGDLTWEKVSKDVERVSSVSSGHMSTDSSQMSDLEWLKAVGDEVVGDGDRKLLWLELLAALDQAMPVDPDFPRGTSPDPEKVPYVDREDLQLEYIESRYFSDITKWFNEEVKERYLGEERIYERNYGASNDDAADATGDGLDSGSGGGGEAGGAELTGPAWVIEIKGYHFHNSDKVISNRTGTYLRNTLLKNLRDMTVTLPGKDGQPTPFRFDELGVSHAIIASESFNRDYTVKNVNHPQYSGGTAASGMGFEFPGADSSASPTGETGAEAETDEPLEYPAPRYDFTIQFVWQPIRLSERLERQEEERKKQEAEAAAKAAAAENGEPSPAVSGNEGA